MLGYALPGLAATSITLSPKGKRTPAQDKGALDTFDAVENRVEKWVEAQHLLEAADVAVGEAREIGQRQQQRAVADDRPHLESGGAHLGHEIAGAVTPPMVNQPIEVAPQERVPRHGENQAPTGCQHPPRAGERGGIVVDVLEHVEQAHHVVGRDEGRIGRVHLHQANPGKIRCRQPKRRERQIGPVEHEPGPRPP